MGNVFLRLTFPQQLLQLRHVGVRIHAVFRSKFPSVLLDVPLREPKKPLLDLLEDVAVQIADGKERCLHRQMSYRPPRQV